MPGELGSIGMTGVNAAPAMGVVSSPGAISAERGISLSGLVAMDAPVAPSVVDHQAPPSSPFDGLKGYDPAIHGGDMTNLGRSVAAPSVMSQVEAIAAKAWSITEPTVPVEMPTVQVQPEVPSVANLEARAQAWAAYMGSFGVHVTAPQAVPEVTISLQPEVTSPVAPEVVISQQPEMISHMPVSFDTVAIKDSLVTHVETLPVEQVLEVAEIAPNVDVVNIATETVVEQLTAKEVVQSNETSDEAVAERVIALAQEVRPDLVQKVEQMVEERQLQRVGETKPAITVVTQDELDEEDEVMPSLKSQNALSPARRSMTPQAPKPEPEDLEKIRIAQRETAERKRLLQQIINDEMERAKKEEREAVTATIADEFEREAQVRTSVRSPLLYKVGRKEQPDGGIEGLAEEVRQTSQVTSLAAENLAAKHPALTPPESVGEEALEKHVRETLYGSRRYAALAA